MCVGDKIFIFKWEIKIEEHLIFNNSTSDPVEANRNFIATLLRGNGKLELKNRQHLLEENVMSASIPSMENIKTPSMEKAIIFNSQ